MRELDPAELELVHGNASARSRKSAEKQFKIAAAQLVVEQRDSLLPDWGINKSIVYFLNYLWL